MTLISNARETLLPNGVRVVTEAMPAVASAAIGVYVGAGARAEREPEHGIAHLLEHMAFKGTRRRSAHAIVDAIEAVGGDINAATSMEQTAYYARVLEGEMALAVDILSDIVLDSMHAAEELAREQGVIRQEIAAVQDTPDDLVFEHLQAAAFPGQPLGRSILGTDESVSSFSRDHVTGFLAAHYVGAQTVVAAAGAIEHDALVADVARCFEAMVQGEPGLPVPARFLGGEMREERDVEQVNVAFALPGAALAADDLHAARVFSSVLGGGMASRLFQEVREKRGLCYTVSSFHWSYADTGLIGFHAGAAPEDVPELLDVMLDVISAAAEDIDASEVQRAKAQARASLLMSLESSPARADRLARQVLLLGEVRPLEEIARRIDAVTVDDVRAVGQRALRAGPAAFAAVGQLGGLASFGEVANTRLGVRSPS